MSKSFLEYERKSLDKLKKYQLPHKYKKIGLIIFFISLLSLFLIPKGTDYKMIAKYTLLLGLLIMSISKEKIEDELIRNLRMQSYTFAFIVVVVITLTNPLFSFIANTLFDKQQDNFSGVGDWQVLWLLLSIQVFYFEYLKKMHK